MFHALGTPSIVSGKPTSLLKLFSLLRTRALLASTAYIASLVDVLPTLPVTATTFGLYLRKVARASSVIIHTTAFLNIFFIPLEIGSVSIYCLDIAFPYLILDITLSTLHQLHSCTLRSISTQMVHGFSSKYFYPSDVD